VFIKIGMDYLPEKPEEENHDGRGKCRDAGKTAPGRSFFSVETIPVLLPYRLNNRCRDL
jgi:hypothetical protein